MQVLKFGGTSVANAVNIKKVAAIVAAKQEDKPLFVVVSAFSGVTDKLLQCGQWALENSTDFKIAIEDLTQQHVQAVKELLPISSQSSLLSWVVQQFHEVEDLCNGIRLLNELSNRSRDRLVSYGELVSSKIISAYFESNEMPNEWVDARKFIVTDAHYTKASVDFARTKENIQQLTQHSAKALFVMPGFIAADEKGNTTTLGRGGSDYTAAIVGACIEASSVEIWTDVSGMMTADPRLVSRAKPIPAISYNEAMELSHFGAKVIYPPTLQPLMNLQIPVWIKNTFSPQDAGTIIEAEAHKNGNSSRGISSINAIALLSLEGSGMVGIPGFSKRLFEALAAHHINVILITQASSEHSICVGVEERFAALSKEVIDKAFAQEIERGLINPLSIEKELAIIALVGDNMKSHQGISGRMFGVLGRNGVNIRAIAQGSSERNISAVIKSVDTRKALNALHEEFFETAYKQVNLFIVGTGNVGSKLLSQLKQQQSYLQEKINLQVRIIGLANSRKMLFNEAGIDVNNWKDALANGEPMKLHSFIERMQDMNLRNSVLVDITANEEVAQVYEAVFKKSISVVACNKIAASSPFVRYKKLKDLSHEFNAPFLFETNVGASLPVIGTLNDLVRSGDTIHRIEAVLSGTLNFVFNHYNGERPFSEVVRQAQEEGYTEPDPRLDLGGTDVMRKIMILARESGAQLEMTDIYNNSFLPSSCMEGSVADFYEEMAKQEDHFRGLYDEAAQSGKKLKFVASFQDGKASVGLKHIDPSHDFYHLYGKDNIVLFYTSRYPEQPLVVKGAGAGAEVTASGVFADIIRAARI
ncbi:MAG TPA: bifunctional aspartate kinase/homoserine dehydrogenase I [Flavisolibacter sp.]|nr:bifunctional aspartate kinase/homoserine dehydrogenase I [Flavisolibacter sp.]